jgi:hypothetical protein
MGTNRFVAPFAGVYYTHIMLTTANWASLVCQMDLLLNGNAVMTNSYMTKSQSNLDSRSRGFILRLNLGDVLRVRLTSGGYYSTSSLYTHFAGLSSAYLGSTFDSLDTMQQAETIASICIAPCSDVFGPRIFNF